MCKTIIAAGADTRNRFLVARGDSLHFGPEIEDLAETDNYEFFKREFKKALRGLNPRVISSDLHPHYISRRVAEGISRRFPRSRFLPVQHHHAHIASVMQEHDLKGPVLGVACDGTGYGLDGNFWGGEFLLVDRLGFKRLAHLAYRKMPGGEKVVYEPWRMVLSILGEKAVPFLPGVKKNDKELVLTIISKNINCPLTSSAGRLFDAAAALLGICLFASRPAQGPRRLEALCDDKTGEGYEFEFASSPDCLVVDTDKLFLGMIKDLKQGREKREIAARFHNSMAAIILKTVERLAGEAAVEDVVLSGGVFQNNYVSSRVGKRLTERGFRVFTNAGATAGDLNISLGQFFVARHVC